MFEILHDLHINSKPSEVYSLISTPRGLNKWWTKDSEGEAEEGSRYRLYFSDEYDWAGKVTKCQIEDYIEWEMIDCSDDWKGTLVGFELFPKDDGTEVRFYHKGWKNQNSEYRGSSYCWAAYLRLLKRYLEHDEFVPYEHRNNA